jgi:hypothetical protein
MLPKVIENNVIGDLTTGQGGVELIVSKPQKNISF